MIFFNSEVILCKDLLVSGIDILHSCLSIKSDQIITSGGLLVAH